MKRYLDKESLYLSCLCSAYIVFYIGSVDFILCDGCFVTHIIYPMVIVSSMLCSFILNLCSQSQNALRTYLSITIMINGICSVYNYWLTDIIIEILTSNHISKVWNEMKVSLLILVFFEILNIFTLLFSISNVVNRIKELKKEQNFKNNTLYEINNNKNEQKWERFQGYLEKHSNPKDIGTPLVIPMNNAERIEPNAPSLAQINVITAPVHVV